VTPAEYLEQERRAEYKSEYFRGEVIAMARATHDHALIVSNLVAALSQQLKDRPCDVYASNLRLRVTPIEFYTYPDVMVICGEVQCEDSQEDTVLNPVVLIEVLSDATQDYDRGQKFQHYRTLPSLKEYLTIAQDAPHVEHWIRQDQDRGSFAEFNNPSQTIQLPTIGCTLPMAEIYRKVDWTSGQ